MSASSDFRTWLNAPVVALLNQLIAQEAKIMAALDDLKAADAAIQTAVTAAIDLINKMRAGSVADADVEAVVADLQKAATALSGAVTPPPPAA